MLRIVSWRDEFWKVLDLNGTSTFSHITNHGKGTKEPSKSVCKTTLEKTLLRSGNGIRWSQTSLSPVELPLWVQTPFYDWFSRGKYALA